MKFLTVHSTLMQSPKLFFQHLAPHFICTPFMPKQTKSYLIHICQNSVRTPVHILRRMIGRDSGQIYLRDSEAKWKRANVKNQKIKVSGIWSFTMFLRILNAFFHGPSTTICLLPTATSKYMSYSLPSWAVTFFEASIHHTDPARIIKIYSNFQRENFNLLIDFESNSYGYIVS